MSVETIPTIQSIPTPPSLATPKTFDADAEAYLFAQRDVFNEMNTIISVLNPVAAAVMQHSQLVADNKSTVQTLASQVVNNTNTVVAKASEVETARSEVATNTQTVSSDKSTVQSLKNSTQTLANQVSSNKNTVVTKASEVETARSEVAANQQTVSSDKSTVQSLKNSTQTLANQVNADKNTVTTKAAEVETARSEVATKAGQVEGDRQRAEAAADSLDVEKLVSQGSNIPGSADLNNYTANGFFHQHQNSLAASGQHYPVDLAGMLEVRSADSMIYQTYHVYSGLDKYHRSFYNGSWYPWRRIWNDSNFDPDSKLDASASAVDSEKLGGAAASEYLKRSGTQSMTGALTTPRLITNQIENENGRVLSCTFASNANPGVGNNDSYFNPGEALEVFRFRPTGSSQNYYVEGVIKAQSSAAVSTLRIRASVRSHVLPSISVSGSYDQHATSDGYDVVRPVFWREVSVNGEVRLVLLFNTGSPAVHDIEGTFTVYQRGAYGEALTIIATHATDDIPNGFSQVELRKEFSSNNGVLKFGAHNMWHEGNDGAGSGLDADTVRGYLPSDTNSPSTLANRDGAGDLHARLFRSTYNNQSGIASGAAFAYRTSETDNYIRFCADMSVVRAHLDVYSKADVDGVIGGSGLELLWSGSTSTSVANPGSIGDILLVCGHFTLPYAYSDYRSFSAIVYTHTEGGGDEEWSSTTAYSMGGNTSPNYSEDIDIQVDYWGRKANALSNRIKCQPSGSAANSTTVFMTKIYRLNKA